MLSRFLVNPQDEDPYFVLRREFKRSVVIRRNPLSILDMALLRRSSCSHFTQGSRRLRGLTETDTQAQGDPESTITS